MKYLSFLFLLLLVFSSCSKDSFFENDELLDNSDAVGLQKNGTQFSGDIGDVRGGDLDINDPGFDIDWCINQCGVVRSDCFDWASENRTYRLADCEDIRIIGTELVDVYCEETSIIGYDQVEVYSPEGEVIRIIDVPIYGTELVICGQEEQDVYSTDPAVIQEYESCKQQAQDEFVDAVDDCDVQYAVCEQNCG